MQFRSLLSFGLAASAFISQAPHAAADTIDVIPVADNTLYFSNSGALSNGGGIGLFVGVTGNGGVRRALVRFDTVAAIPPGSTINSVSLSLIITQTQSSSAIQTAHRITSDWGEGTTMAGGGEGGGGAAANGDVTWIHTFRPSTFWTNAGGDFVSTASAQQTALTSGTTVVFSGAGMVADVQAWVDGTAPEYGWLIKDSETGGSARRFSSREFLQFEPRLLVDFDPPANLISSTSCLTGVNTSGGRATLIATGSDVALDDDVTLIASGVPANQFGIFVTSLTPGMSATTNLCLGGSIGRFNQPGQVLNAGPGGTMTLPLTLSEFPQGSMFVTAMAGETWYFQGWFRDLAPADFDFTDAISVTFQ